MENPSTSRWRWDILWVVLWLCLSSVWCVSAARQLSATFDEPFYLEQGLSAWRTGSFAGLLHKGTMPLPAHVQALPLWLGEWWTGQAWDLQADFEQMLTWFRAGNLVFWWLLVIYGGFLASQLAGPWAGRIAVVVLACEPNLLGHAALGTTDIALTACLLALIYHFRAGRERAWFWRVGLPMFWFAASVLAKASGVVFGPICLFVLELQRQWKAAPPLERDTLWERCKGRCAQMWRDIRPYLRDSFALYGGGLVLVFLYCGTDGEALPSFQRWASKLPAGLTKEAMVWTADNLRIFSNAGEGIARQIKHNFKGHDVFLLGQSSRHALWYYFPAVLTMKLPWVTLLVLLGVALMHPRSLNNSALVLAGALFAFSLTCRVQVGMRLVFPLVVLLELGIVAAMVASLRERHRAGGRFASMLPRFGSSLATLALAWLGVSAVTVWPHGLCYVNEFWGGKDGAYLLVSGADYDWGQGLMELRDWQRHHGAEMDVWYFGTDPRYARLPVRNLPLHHLPIQHSGEVAGHVRSRYLAVGTTALYSHGLTHAHQQAARFLREQQPCARTQTFLIFDTEPFRPVHLAEQQEPAGHGR